MRFLQPDQMTDGDRERARRVRAICEARGWTFEGLIDPKYMPPGPQPNNCHVALKFEDQLASAQIPRADPVPRRAPRNRRASGADAPRG